MPTTTITIASFQTACAEVGDAIAAESWATARKWYAQAEAINAGLDLDISNQGARTLRRESLAGLKAAIDSASTALTQASDRRRFIGTTTRYPR